MKRIANKVALQTLLYTIPGTQWIQVVDYPNFWAMSSDSSDNHDKGEIVFDGRVSDLIYHTDCKYVRICRSQCRNITTRSNDVDGGSYLVVCITSSEEEF